VKRNRLTAKKKRKVHLESLEPRILLSADLSYTMSGGANDLTLKLQNNDGTDTLQLINNSDQNPDTQIVQSQSLAETTGVRIIGSDQSDQLTIDFNRPFLLSDGIWFTDGFDGDADVLQVIGKDNVWTLAGANQGQTDGGIEFFGVENLTGGPDNEDTFIVSAGCSLSGVIDGGAGGFDTMVVDAPSSELIELAATGPDAGTVTIDGQVITYTGLEPVSISGMPTNVVVDLPDTFLGAGVNDEAEISQSGDTITVKSTSTPTTFELTNFGAPSLASHSLTVNGNGGNDRVTITSLDLGYATLEVNAEQIFVTGNLTAGDVTLEAVDEASGDPLEDITSELGPLQVKLPGSITGAYLATPTAVIDLTGATLDVANLVMTAEAKAEFDPVPATLGGVSGAVAYVKSRSEIVIDRSNITAESIDADATTTVAVAAQDDPQAVDADSTDADAGIAVIVVDADTTAKVTGANSLPSSLIVSGAVDFQATADVTAESVTDGKNGFGGATMAVAIAVIDTQAYFDGSVTFAGGFADTIALEASTTSDISAIATSTPGGAEENAGSNKTQETLGDPQRDGSDTENDSDRAATGEGDLNFAGAFALTVVDNETSAYIDTDMSVTTETALDDADIDVAASSTDTVMATADGSNTGDGATGVGVAVALNFTTVKALAWLDGSGSFSADALNVTATNAGGDTYSARATSGAGDTSSVGVAGSLAINVVTTTVEATVKNEATFDLNGTSLNLIASNTVKSTAEALPAEESGDEDGDGRSGEGLGVGASVALNIANNDTRSAVETDVMFTNAGDVSLTSGGDYMMDTEARGGSAGGIALTPVVAVSIALNDTVAEVAPGGSALVMDGNLSLEAEHSSHTDTLAAGDAKGDNAALGAALAFTSALDNSFARLQRDVTSTGGAVTLAARGAAATRSKSKASAAGAGQDDAGDSSDDNQVNEQVDAQRTMAEGRSEGGTGNEATPVAETSDNDGDGSNDSVSVAAAISINIAESNSMATIADGVKVDADGMLSMESKSNADSVAIADGSSSEGTLGIGAAVALNVAKTINEASLARHYPQ
jgi:hypothetical protein